MKNKPSKFVEQNRIREGPLRSDAGAGNNGAFAFVYDGAMLWVVVSDQGGWDHVSVHASEKDEDRTPTWDEMCYVKDLFFRRAEWVMQYHPDRAAYKNIQPHVLHLWRPQNKTIPKPPEWMV